MSEGVTKQRRRARKCEWCRTLFQPAPIGRPPMYCSRSCKQRAYEARRRRSLATSLAAALRADFNDALDLRRSVTLEVLSVLRRLGIVPAEVSAEQLAAFEEELRLEQQYAMPPRRSKRRRE